MFGIDEPRRTRLHRKLRPIMYLSDILKVAYSDFAANIARDLYGTGSKR